MKNADEPAFPISEEETDRIDKNVSIYFGLTKREYFARNAPNEIPEWFEHVSQPKPKEPFSWVSITELHQFYGRKDELKGWQHDPCYDLPEELQWYQVAWEDYWEMAHLWKIENQKSRFFQWKTFYADELLKQLEA